MAARYTNKQQTVTSTPTVSAIVWDHQIELYVPSGGSGVYIDFGTSAPADTSNSFLVPAGAALKLERALGTNLYLTRAGTANVTIYMYGS